MTHAAEPARTETGAAPAASDPDAIRADIEQTRAELAQTVDALSDKLNVKAQAVDKAAAKVGPHRKTIAAGAVAALIVVLAVRRRRRPGA